MKEDDHFLSDPIASEGLEKMFAEFARETDRGAVLIAAEIVSASLGDAILENRPEDFSEKKLKLLLSYPGSIATFAARADIAFLSSAIDYNIHTSIGKLRSIRNKAAHSKDAFNLAEFSEQLDDICDLGTGTATLVHTSSIKLVLESFIESLMAKGPEYEAEFGHNPFASAKEVAELLAERPDAMQKLEGEVPKVKLALGVWLVLGLIRHRLKARSFHGDK